MMGRANGIASINRWIKFAPSILAESKISSGMVSKKPVKRST